MPDSPHRPLGAPDRSWLDTLVGPLRRLVGRRLPVWYHPDYRLPMPDLLDTTGIDTRRADLALWALLGHHNARHLAIHGPVPAPYAALARVHTMPWLESLTRPEALAAVFGLPPDRFPVDATLHTIRLAVGGTMAATHHVLTHRGPALNLLGGFHHALPDRGHGLCPVNDVATAIADARIKGFGGTVLVLDLDAHPPDGTAACLAGDPAAKIASLSGSDWGPLPGVDETVIPGADDETYLAALDALLQRNTKPDLAYVLAGGDVMGGDRMGLLSLTREGVRERDARVAAWLGDTPAVWLPAGGYRADAWRVLADTACRLIGPHASWIPESLNPVERRFEWVSRGLHPADLAGRSEEALITAEEVDAMFGAVAGPPRLLGFYTAQGVEHGLEAYGMLGQLRRLGYDRFHVDLDKVAAGDRARLSGEADGVRHLLWELVLSRTRLAGEVVVGLEWMTLRHPLGRFTPDRPPLPGQDVPGSGLADEAVHLVLRIADRLDLAGVLYRPAWVHTAAFALRRFHFVDPQAQGDLEALLRDLGPHGIAAVSRAVAAGRVRRDGTVWAWPAEAMIAWRGDRAEPDTWRAAADRRRDATTFTLDPVT